MDDGTTRGGLLRGEVLPDATAVTLTPATSGGSLVEGRAYDYRFVFVDSAIRGIHSERPDDDDRRIGDRCDRTDKLAGDPRRL